MTTETLMPQIHTSKETKKDQPIHIGSRLELFVDRTLMDQFLGTELRLHSPVRQPLAKSPLVGGYATIIKDGDRYLAIYRDFDTTYAGKTDYDGHPGEVTCYAESQDGIEWSYPELGLHEIAGSKRNNVILAGQPPFCHSFAAFLDTRPGVKPAERFKGLSGARARIFDRVLENLDGIYPNPGRPGLHAFCSPDGIHWQKMAGEPVIPHQDQTPAGATWFDSSQAVFWSEAEGCYVCYFRTMETPHGELRTISRSVSPDYLNWSAPEPMNPNEPGEHLYTSSTHPYFRAPHIYIALPTRYFRMPRPGDMGTTDIVFMATRAGSNKFSRLFTEAFIRPGLDQKRWKNRSNYVAIPAVIPLSPEEMGIYHWVSGHRYVLRTDGFISIRAGGTPGEFLTRPLIFSGRKLILNYSTSAGGRLKVEIQTAAGQPIQGYELKDCPDIVGDKIAGEVTWKDGTSAAGLAGRPVRLRFSMKECDLYSMQFQ